MCPPGLREEHRAWVPEVIAGITLRLDASCERVSRNIPAPVRRAAEQIQACARRWRWRLPGWIPQASTPTAPRMRLDPGLVRLRDRVRLDWQDSWPQTLSELEIELDGGRRVRGPPRCRHSCRPTSPSSAARASPPNSMRWSRPVLGASRHAGAARAIISGLDGAADIRPISVGSPPASAAPLTGPLTYLVTPATAGAHGRHGVPACAGDDEDRRWRITS